MNKFISSIAKFFKHNTLNIPRETQFKCANCGQFHDQLPAIGFKAPFHYCELSEEEKSEIAEISNDFCIITHPDQTDRFIRTVLTIPINDACEDLDYGIWVSLSERSFEDYKSNFKNDAEEVTYFGTVCNDILHYKESTVGLHVNVSTQKGNLRPEILLHENTHPLVTDWQDGIKIKDALQQIEKMESK